MSEAKTLPEWMLAPCDCKRVDWHEVGCIKYYGTLTKWEDEPSGGKRSTKPSSRSDRGGGVGVWKKPLRLDGASDRIGSETITLEEWRRRQG